MDIKHLRTFVTVARLGSITKTAEALHLTQPAVSGQIKSLEEALDVKLLLRTPTALTLTGAGQDLKLRAEKVIDAFGEFVNAAKSRRGAVAGQLRIGLAMYDPAVMRVGALMQRLARDYPGLRVDLQVGRISWFYDALRIAEIDAAISVCRNSLPGIAEVPLKNMVFELVMPAAWDVPANPDPDALLALPWIRMSPRSAHFDMMREIQQQIGAPRLEVMEADHEAVIHALVAAGVGIGLLRQELAEMGEARGELKRLRTLSLIHI